MIESASLIYKITLLAVSIFVAFKVRGVDKASKIICNLIWLGLITETIGLYAAKQYRNNYPVYNISIFVEFVLISLYFNYCVAQLRKRNIGIYIAGGGIILGIINTLFLQPLVTTLNSNLLCLECLVVVCLSLYSIYGLLRIDDDNLQLQKEIHFWIPCIMLFYQCSSLWSWGMYDSFGNNDKEKAAILDIFVLSVNIISYLSLGVLFFFYSKMKRIHV